MSKQKEIFAAIRGGEITGTWGTWSGTSPRAIARQIKRAEAEERNARTSPERRRAARTPKAADKQAPGGTA